MKENGKFKWYLSWWFMLILFVPTLGIGTMIVAAIRLYKTFKNDNLSKKKIIVSGCYLVLGFLMCKYMLTPVPEDDFVETSNSTVSTTTIKPVAKKTVKVTEQPTKKPTATPVVSPTVKPTVKPVKKYDDDTIFTAVLKKDKSKCKDISEADAYGVMFEALQNYVKMGAKTEDIVDFPSSYLSMYAGKNKEHTKTMQALKKNGTTVRRINGMLPCDEQWVKSVKPFCTNYDSYNVYTGADVLYHSLNVWGRDFKYGYHSYLNDKDIIVCSVEPLTKEGRQDIFLIDTKKNYTYKRDGYNLKLRIYIAVDMDEVIAYEDEAGDMDIDAYKKKSDDAYSNIKKILGVK